MAKKLLPELKYVESMHEQREFNNLVIPMKGDWLEIGKFTPVIETFDIDKRYKCIEHNVGKDGKITIVIKELNFNQQENNKKKIIDKIMKKHNDLLVASILKSVIKGVHLNRTSFERFKARVKNINDKKKFKDWEKKDAIEYKVKNLEETINKRTETLEKLKKDLIFWGRDINGQKTLARCFKDISEIEKV